MSYRKGWEEVILKDVCVKIGSGATPKGGKSSYLEKGEISLIRSQNILDFNFTYNGIVYINEKQAKKLSNVKIQEKDVLINITGDSVARVCQVPTEVIPARVNQHVSILRVNNELLLSEFLMYLLLNPTNKQLLLSLSSTGGTRNALTKGMLEDFKIKLPPLPIQNRIASILSAFDEKIEVNRQMNATLEAMAQAMFRKYFIKTSFEATLNIDKYINFNPRLSIKKGTKVDFLEMKAVPTEGMNVDYTYPKAFKSGMKFQNNDTLLARITPCLQNGKTAFVNFLNETEIGFGSTEFIVMRAKTNISPQFVYCLARNEDFRQHAINSMVGSSGRQRIQLDMLKDFKIAKIDMAVMKQFDIDTLPFFEKIKLNGKEINTLSKTRDLLLPKLMSGEIPA